MFYRIAVSGVLPVAWFRDVDPATVTRVFEALRAEPDLTIVDPTQLLCDSQKCSVVLDGTPLYRDDNHLSLRGCVLVSDLFDHVFAGSAAVQ